MTDETVHERMKRVESLSEDITERRRERDALADEVAGELAGAIESAVAEAGAAVEPLDRSDDRFRFRARLDRASLVAALADELPSGFAVSRLEADGSLGIEWTDRERPSTSRRHDAVLKAILGEEVTTDGDGLVESVPTRERVLDRAVDLGIEREEATERLDRLVTLGVVDVADDKVYPDTNFSRF